MAWIKNIDLDLWLNRNRRTRDFGFHGFPVIEEIPSVDLQCINNSGCITAGYPLHQFVQPQVQIYLPEKDSEVGEYGEKKEK